MRLNLVDVAYHFYFRLMALSTRRSGVVVFDIDNTINHQEQRLRRFVQGNFCDYRRANRFAELLRDEPKPAAIASARKWGRRAPVVWLTARSIKSALPTWLWLRAHGLPIHRVVFTGQTPRKIDFLRTFIEIGGDIQLVVDDMQEGYEFDRPAVVEEYRQFLSGRGIRFVYTFDEVPPQ